MTSNHTVDDWNVVTKKSRPGKTQRDQKQRDQKKLREFNEPQQSEDSRGILSALSGASTPEPVAPAEPTAAQQARNGVAQPTTPPQFLQLPPWALTCKFASTWDHHGMDDWEKTQLRERLLKSQLYELRGTAPLAKQSYIAQSLRDNEQCGFHASSAILWRSASDGDIEFLMAYERRNNRMGLNFFGGKRDHIEEMAAMTMCRELREETSGLLNIAPQSITGPIMWHPESKQAVFIHELTDTDVVQRIQDLGHPPELARDLFECHGARPAGVVTAAWVSARMLRETNFRKHLHQQCASMIDGLVQGATSTNSKEAVLDSRLAQHLISR